MMRTLVFEDISRRWGFLMMHYVHTLLKSCNQGIFACGSSFWSSPFPIEDANSANTRYPIVCPFYSLDSLKFLALYIMLEYLSSRVLSRGVNAPYPSPTGRIVLMSLPPLKREYSANWANVLLIEPPLPIGELVICSLISCSVHWLVEWSIHMLWLRL